MDGIDSKLRSLIASCDECQRRFSEAESLAKSIFKRKRHPKIVPLPFFTEHGSTHCEAVEKYLNGIIWERKEKSRYDFIPNEEEAMYLHSAVWLHDIGMWYGLRDDEEPEDLNDIEKVVELRGEHEERTAKYIQEKWSDALNWTEEQKEYLATICFYHRKHPIGTLEPATIAGHHGDVRLNALSALLRLADAWHVDQSRAPALMESLYISLGMKGEALQHWKRAGLIKSVEKDETDISSKKIKVTGNYPDAHEFELGKPERGMFDLKDVGDIVCGDIRAELWSVRPVLSQYPNTCFVDVIHNFRHMKALGKGEERYLALWPYLLNKLTSSTETTAALVEVLLFAAKRGLQNLNRRRPWRKRILDIIVRVQDSHPFDFMIRNLCEDVKKKVCDKHTLAEELIKYLKDVKKNNRDDCNKMAEHAIDVINPGESMILYGHSTNTLRLLEEIPQKESHQLYIVECYREASTHLKENEDKKIKNRVYALGFKNVRFVYFHAFAQALVGLEREKRACKFLLGTHGVVREQDENNKIVTKEFVCKIGSSIIASMAKRLETAEVVIFAGNEKILRNGLSPNDIAGWDKLFSWENGKGHPELGIPYLPPTMDIVPISIVDYYVSEEGVFDAKTDQPVGRRVTGKKVSSPR